MGLKMWRNLAGGVLKGALPCDYRVFGNNMEVQDVSREICDEN
jgi:hypothetical protein